MLEFGEKHHWSFYFLCLCVCPCIFVGKVYALYDRHPTFYNYLTHIVPNIYFLLNLINFGEMKCKRFPICTIFQSKSCILLFFIRYLPNEINQNSLACLLLTKLKVIILKLNNKSTIIKKKQPGRFKDDRRHMG